MGLPASILKLAVELDDMAKDIVGKDAFFVATQGHQFSDKYRKRELVYEKTNLKIIRNFCQQ